MKLKPIITEVIILLVIYIIARLFVPFLTASWGRNASLDINLHDTYFVFDFVTLGTVSFIYHVFFSVIYYFIRKYSLNVSGLVQEKTGAA